MSVVQATMLETPGLREVPNELRMSLSEISTMSKSQAQEKTQEGKSHIRATRMKLHNTYQLQPDRAFPEGRLKRLMGAFLEENLAGRKYHPEVCARLARQLSEDLKTKLKDVLGYNRYKFVTLVTLDQKDTCCMSLASRSLWNHNFDRRVEVAYETGDIYAMALVFAVYVE